MIKISPKRYILIFFTIMFVMILFTTALASKSLFFDSIFEFQKLYRHQLDKLFDCDEVETIFVGDSSLGNAVDADLFSQLSSSKSMNLSLTVLYGYAGTYNMIKKAIKNYDIKNIVIVQTVDTLSRPTSYNGYLYTMESIDDFIDLQGDEKGNLTKAFYNTILSPKNLTNILKHYMGKQEKTNVIENDFIRQRERIDIHQTVKPIKDPINKDKIRFLLKIRELCEKNNINLIYAHGPLWEPVGMKSIQYIDKVNTIIADTGIQLIPDVTLITTDDIGDTEFHIIPDVKEEYTVKYFDLIHDYLVY